MATLPAGALMQRAAAGLARRCAMTLRGRTGGVYGSHVLILVGTGNNGGDAMYAGAALARRGAAVTAVTVDPNRLHHGAARALRAAGGTVLPGSGRGALPKTTDLVVDGLLGIGGSGGLRQPAADLVAAAELVEAADGGRAPVIAVDVPSGVHVDTGAVAGRPAVMADVTVTFGALKPGLLVGAGAVHSGLVELVDLGLLPALRTDPALSVPDLSDIAAWWPRPLPEDNKYTRGVVGLATGSAGYPGAGVLSTSGALVGPAGMVRYAGAVAAEVQRSFPTVVTCGRAGEAGRVQAWVCGCGLGTDEQAVTELRSVLASAVPVCLDADAITLLVDGSMAGALRRRKAPIVLTPHDREFARLAGHDPGENRVEAALRLAAQVRAVILLKGYRTIVATPDGRAFVNPTGTPALATAGTGDVLAGMIGALLACGVAPERAALAAAYVHGLAGRLASEAGPMTADELAIQAKKVIAGLG